MSAVLKSIPPVATPTGTGRLDIDQVSIHLGEGAQRFVALDEVSLTIEPGEFVCLLGPSGCGKSTLLGALAGHLQPTHGEARLDGQRIDGPDPQRGLVFQHHTLFPWLSVQDNVAYGLKMRGVSRSERLQQAQALLKEVGLQGFEQRYPHALSGGMQQRVEIARVLINQPRVLLMDEPFAALDEFTRQKLNDDLLQWWQAGTLAVLFVTHSIYEAVYLSQRVLVMGARPGRVVDEVRIDEPYPRRAAFRSSAHFLDACRRIGQALDATQAAG